MEHTCSFAWNGSVGCKACFDLLREEKSQLTLQVSELKAMEKKLEQREALLEQRAEVAERLNGELVALIRKIDAFFEDPRILTGDHTVILDIPYEIAAGVKAVLTTPQKRVEGGQNDKA